MGRYQFSSFFQTLSPSSSIIIGRPCITTHPSSRHPKGSEESEKASLPFSHIPLTTPVLRSTQILLFPNLPANLSASSPERPSAQPDPINRSIYEAYRCVWTDERRYPIGWQLSCRVSFVFRAKPLNSTRSQPTLWAIENFRPGGSEDFMSACHRQRIPQIEMHL